MLLIHLTITFAYIDILISEIHIKDVKVTIRRKKMFLYCVKHTVRLRLDWKGPNLFSPVINRRLLPIEKQMSLEQVLVKHQSFVYLEYLI